MSSANNVLRTWAALAAAVVSASLPAAAAPSMCTSAETVAFSCQAGTKIVSLCTSASKNRGIDTLVYRYGVPGHVENEFVASHANIHRFFGTVEPAAPRAWVSQVWFTRGDVMYLLSECIGGDCPRHAGLSVLRNGKVVSNKSCSSTPDDRGWFAKDLVEFGSDIKDSRSHTDLLKLEEGDNPIEQIYPIRGDW